MLLIQNARVMDPKTNTDKVADVLVEDGKIKEIGIVPVTDEMEIIDANGLILAPGFIDVHVHFRDPGQTRKEDLVTGSKAAAAGGFTTVICMANTIPKVDNVDTLTDILERAKELPIHVLQASAVTKNFNGRDLVDMEAMKEAGAVGFTDDGLPIMNAGVLKKAMEEAKRLNVPISLHEEDSSLVIKAGINKSPWQSIVLLYLSSGAFFPTKSMTESEVTKSPSKRTGFLGSTKILAFLNKIFITILPYIIR